MLIESKKVPCIECHGTGKILSSFYSWHTGEKEMEEKYCPHCLGAKTMEVRKKEDSEWEACCSDCAGKGFIDEWDYYREEHSTSECANCNGTGGILYTLPVE